jgi:DNA-binding PadR family transcriptional regulator
LVAPADSAARADLAVAVARRGAATSAPRRCCCSPRSRATATRSCRRSSSAATAIWRPSPGSVYPALSQLEDEGLIRSEEHDGRKVFALTDAGREHVAARAEGAAAPWDTLALGGVSSDVRELGGLMRQVAIAFSQLVQTASESQVAEAKKVLSDARRALYRILGEGDA